MKYTFKKKFYSKFVHIEMELHSKKFGVVTWKLRTCASKQIELVMNNVKLRYLLWCWYWQYNIVINIGLNNFCEFDLWIRLIRNSVFFISSYTQWRIFVWKFIWYLSWSFFYGNLTWKWCWEIFWTTRLLIQLKKYL